MRRMSVALAATIAMSGVFTGLTAQAASAAAASGPPYSYAECIAAAKKKGESARHAKWHCDQLVKKGWVKPPRS